MTLMDTHKTPTTASSISKELFLELVQRLGQQGLDDIAWAESLRPPVDPDQFAFDAIFVVCNSGMHHRIAQKIFDKCVPALLEGRPVIGVFKHPGKAQAIETLWRDRVALLAAYNAATDKLAFCQSLPWIGAITKFHLAKNYAAEVAKPDVHLQRLADRAGVTPQALCESLAKATGWRVGTVDTLLWRLCATGILDSRTGIILEEKQ